MRTYLIKMDRVTQGLASHADGQYMYPSKARRRKLKALTADIGLEAPIPGTVTYGVYEESRSGWGAWSRGHLTEAAAKRDISEAEQVTGLNWYVAED